MGKPGRFGGRASTCPDGAMTAIQRTTFEVAPTSAGWIVTRAGFGRDSTHPTKDAAIKRAVRLARDREPSELVIHRRDGSIQETRSYGSDPERLVRIQR